MPETTPTIDGPNMTTATADSTHGVLRIRVATGTSGLWLPTGEADDGSEPLAGATVTITPTTTQPIVDTHRRTVIAPAPRTVTTDSRGEAGVRLIATNSPGAEGAGLRWNVTVESGGQTLRIPGVDIYADVELSLWEAAAQVARPRKVERLDGEFRLHTSTTPKLITNAMARYYPEDAKSSISHYWVVTAGTIFARGGVAWSGKPDFESGGFDSDTYTGSGVFRMWTRKATHYNTRLTMEIKPITEGAVAEKANFFDGGHLMLRCDWQRDYGYFITFLRSDDKIVIKRKDRDYTTLAEMEHVGTPVGQWTKVWADAVDEPGGCRVRLGIGAQVLLDVIDPAPLPAGLNGLRCDNLEFECRGMVTAEVTP